MKLNIEELAREAGSLLRSPPDWWIEAFARSIVERCALEADVLDCAFRCGVGQEAGSAIRNLLED